MSLPNRPDSDLSPVASIIVVATNELHHLEDCLPSLAKLDGPVTEVIVVDNDSADGTQEALAEKYPWVRVVRSDQRLGYAPANNLGFKHARGEYLVVLNPDTRVDPAFVCGLVSTCRMEGNRALVTSRVCMFDAPDRLNTVGNSVHFSMIAACRGLDQPCESRPQIEEVPSISGCAFLIPRAVIEEMGDFDESIYPYLEDTEISLRGWVSGFSCVSAPSSIVYHKYRIRLQPQKFFHIERNRWLVILRTFKVPTIAVLSPALILVELMSWAYALKVGRAHLFAKARSYASIIRFLPEIRHGRRQTRELRRVRDREVLARLDTRLPIGQLVQETGAPGRAIEVIDSVIGAYFRVTRRLVWW